MSSLTDLLNTNVDELLLNPNEQLTQLTRYFTASLEKKEALTEEEVREIRGAMSTGIVLNHIRGPRLVCTEGQYLLALMAEKLHRCRTRVPSETTHYDNLRSSAEFYYATGHYEKALALLEETDDFVKTLDEDHSYIDYVEDFKEDIRNAIEKKLSPPGRRKRRRK